MSEEIKEPMADYGYYSYADYITWNIKERIEIIKGKIFKMSPAPSTSHQRTLLNLVLIIENAIGDKGCQLFVAPFDVRLIDPDKQSSKDEDIHTVFQPDLCVICDESKIDERGCLGAPDFIVEILSPGNSKKDINDKYRLYEENGVQEYWIVDYQHRVVHRYILRDGHYIGLRPIIEDSTVSSHIFPDLSFECKEVFKNLK